MTRRLDVPRCRGRSVFEIRSRGSVVYHPSVIVSHGTDINLRPVGGKSKGVPLQRVLPGTSIIEVTTAAALKACEEAMAYR